MEFINDNFRISTLTEKTYTARIVVGAYGKRSSLDKLLKRPFFLANSPWIGVKAHYRADFPDNLVALHNFDGGYCGLSQVENKVVNGCYLTNYASFKKHKNIQTFSGRGYVPKSVSETFFLRMPSHCLTNQ